MAGRKKKPGVKRTASGKISRAADAYQEHLDPIATRMRLFDLTEEQAHNQKAATAIGRLCLTNKVTEDEYLASQQYLSQYEAFKRAVKAPDALRSSTGGGDQGESETYAEWCQQAIARYEATVRAIDREQQLLANRGANLYAALDYVVVRGECYDHLIRDCGIALNALVNHFSGKKVKRLDERREAA